MKQLAEAGLASDFDKGHDCALITFNKCNDFDHILEEWDKKSKIEKTWMKVKRLVANEYSKLKLKADKQNAKTAGFEMTVNVIET